VGICDSAGLACCTRVPPLSTPRAWPEPLHKTVLEWAGPGRAGCVCELVVQRGWRCGVGWGLAMAMWGGGGEGGGVLEEGSRLAGAMALRGGGWGVGALRGSGVRGALLCSEDSGSREGRDRLGVAVTGTAWP
jgi:hypothetical protein